MRGCMSNRKQEVEKARDRRTTQSWKIKSWSGHGVRCLLMHTGTSQTAKRYRQRIEDQYFGMMVKYPNRTPHTFRSLHGRCEVIKSMCSRWAACLEQVRNAPPSGTMESDYVSLFCLCSICASSYLHHGKWLHHFTLFTLCRTRFPNIDTKTWKLRKANSSN